MEFDTTRTTNSSSFSIQDECHKSNIKGLIFLYDLSQMRGHAMAPRDIVYEKNTMVLLALSRANSVLLKDFMFQASIYYYSIVYRWCFEPTKAYSSNLERFKGGESDVLVIFVSGSPRTSLSRSFCFS